MQGTSRNDLLVVREVGETHLLPKFRAFLSGCGQALQPSEMYAPATETKFRDEDKRKSEFRSIRSEELFALAREYVQDLSTSDAQNDFMLVPNDITEIRYKAGGFFKSHTDFLSTTSNLIEEYTLLLCVTPDDVAAEIKGGETIIHGFGGKSVSFGATTTPGWGMLFRKDLSHEGALVEAGEKHILSFNIWGLRKHTGQVVLVTFPGEDDASAASAGQGSASDMHAVSAGRWYAIPASDVSGSGGMLLTHLEWINRSADDKGEPRPHIVRYCCEDFNFDQFSTVFRIIIRSYITPEAFLAGSAAIKFFGPFKYEEFLVEFDTQVPALEALAPLAVPASGSCAACGAKGAGVTILQCSRCKEACFCSEECFQKDYFRHSAVCSAAIATKEKKEASLRKYKKLKVAELKQECKEKQLPLKGIKLKDKLVELLVHADIAPPVAAAGGSGGSAAPPHPPALDDDVIVCDSEERTAVLCEIARELHLDYVRFKVLFAEGTLAYTDGAEHDFSPLPMVPAWITVGDYDNLFCSQNLHNHGALAVEQFSMQDAMQQCFALDPETLAKIGSEFPCGAKSEGRDNDLMGIQEETSRQFPDLFGYNLLLAPYQGDPSGCMGNYGLRPYLGEAAMLCIFGESGEPGFPPPHEWKYTLLPGGADYGVKTASGPDQRDGAGGADTDTAREPSLYHRDSHNKVCFSKAEALAASEHIAAMKLDEKVKACLQKRRFQLSQKRESVSSYFCNETLYGELNVLYVSGVVRMDAKDKWTFQRAAQAGAAGADVPVPFDVWPEQRPDSDDWPDHY